MSNGHLPNSNATARSRSQPPTVSSIFLVKERIHHTLKAHNLAFIGPLSWVFTLQIFAISVMWWMVTLPIGISIDIYDRHIRARFPRLPSIRILLLSVRTTVLAIVTSKAPASRPGVSSASGRPQGRRGRNAPADQHPTLNVDLNSLLADGS